MLILRVTCREVMTEVAWFAKDEKDQRNTKHDLTLKEAYAALVPYL